MNRFLSIRFKVKLINYAIFEADYGWIPGLNQNNILLFAISY